MILLKNNSQRSYSTLNVDKFLFGKDEVEMMTNKPKAWITSWGIVFQKNDKTKCDLELNDEDLLLQSSTLPLKYELH